MSKSLKEFYEKQKYLFDITTVLFVVTTLILNVKPESGFKGQTLELLQFFLLLGSIISLSFLILFFWVAVASPIIENISVVGDGKDPKNIKKSVRGLSAVLFTFLITIVFVLALILYLVLSFNREVISLALAAAAYFLFYLITPLLGEMNPKTGLGKIALITTWIVFWLVLPVLFFTWLYVPNSLVFTKF